MGALEVFTNNPSTTVTAGGTDSPAQGTPQTWTVLSSTGFPAASTGVTQFHIGDPDAPSEVILVTNVSGTSWSVVRGAESSPVVSHSAGFTVVQIVTAGWLGSITPGSFVNPMTAGGDTIYGAPGGAAARRAGNITTTKQFLASTGSGGTANAPVWGTIASADVPVLNQNTSGSAATAGTAAAVSGTIGVTHGGTGLGSFATYGLVAGGTASTTPLQQVAGAGTVGQVLTSNGPGLLPTWQPATGGTGSGSSVAFPITVPEGGFGGTQATAYAVVTGGTTSTSPFQQVASVGGSGQVLVSQGAGQLPQWVNNTGGSVTFPVTVGEGGSGGTAVTAYSVLTGGTTATDAFQAVTSASGSIGYVLTSNGTGVLPSWQRPTGGTGISNPMSSVGDMITGGAGNPALATRLANPGTAGLALTTNNTGQQPTWQYPPSDWFNVMNFGAKGDGVTNDTGAIQRAVAAAAAAGLGSTVYFPAGTYIVRSPIIVPPTIVLLGSGQSLAYYGGSQSMQESTPILQPDSGWASVSVGGTAGTSVQTVNGVIAFLSQHIAGYPAGSSNQVVRNITINGHGSTAPAGVNGIEGWGAVWGVRLEDVGVFGMGGWGIQTSKASAGTFATTPDFWQLYGVHLANNGNSGTGVGGGGSMASIGDSYFIGCEATGNNNDGWDISGDNIKIVGCKAEYNNGDGLSIARSTGSRPILINGFGTDGNTGNGISLTGSGPGPVVINGAGLNQDGWNNGSGGNFGGLSVTGGMNVSCTGLFVTTSAVNSPGGPKYGVYLPSTFTGVLQLANCNLYGDTAGIFQDPASTGSVVTGSNVLTGVGNWETTPTNVVYQPLMAPGGGLGAAQPVNHSLVAWTFDPALAGNHFAYTSGTQYLCGVYINQNVTLSHIYWAVGATATTITSGQNYVGLVSSTTGALLTSTASGAIDSQMATTGLKSAAVTGAAVTPGLYWVVLLFNYSGASSLQIEGGGNGIAAVTNAGLSVPGTYRYAIPSGGTGKVSLSNFPVTVGSNALSAPSYWAAVDV